jgi:SET domain-containing protein
VYSISCAYLDFLLSSDILSPVMKKRKPHVIVKRSCAGLGLYAKEDVKRGAHIIDYTGEKITTDEADRRGGKYLFTLNKKWVVDGKGRENIARYINHSCKPNCEPEIDESNWTINILAKRAIKLGEELTYDYGKEYWDDHIKPHGCRCVKCI